MDHKMVTCSFNLVRVAPFFCSTVAGHRQCVLSVQFNLNFQSFHFYQKLVRMEFVEKSYEDELELENKLGALLKDVKLLSDESMWARTTLMRFLRFFDYDVIKSEVRIRKYIDFITEKNLIGAGNREVDKEILRLLPAPLIGRDSLGRPVSYTSIKNWKCDELMKVGYTMEDVEYHTAHVYEHIIMQLVRLNETLEPGQKLVTDFICITDYGGFSMSKAVSQGFKLMKIGTTAGEVVSTYYPDMPIAIVINASKMIQAACKSFSSTLPGNPHKKMMYGKEWEMPISRYLDLKMLEPYL